LLIGSILLIDAIAAIHYFPMLPMKRFISIGLQRFFTLLFACCLSIGTIWADGWLPVHSLLSTASGQPIVEEPAFTAAETEKFAETLPYWLWLVLPRIFPEYLNDKGGYLSLGMAWEAGKGLPVGITATQSGGIEQVAISCIACHGGGRDLSNLSPPASSQRLTMPGTKFDHRRYHQFLVNCARDPRFTANYILPAIEYNHPLSPLQKLRYRWLIIPRVKKQLLA
jgi:hypothetical protein